MLERGNGSFDLETVSFFLQRPPFEILTYPPFKYGLYPVKIEPSNLVLLLAVPVCNVWEMYTTRAGWSRDAPHQLIQNKNLK